MPALLTSTSMPPKAASAECRTDGRRRRIGDIGLRGDRAAAGALDAEHGGRLGARRSHFRQ